MSDGRNLQDNVGADRFFKNMQDAFFMMKVLLDEEGNPYNIDYVYVNEAVYRLTRLHKEDYDGKLFSEIFGSLPPAKWLEPYYDAAYKNICRTWRDYSEEIQEYVEISCFPLYDGCAGCFVKNITDKTLYEKTLQSTQLAYREIYFIDLNRDQYQIIFPTGNVQERGCYSDAVVRHFANGKIVDDHREEVSRFLSIEKIREGLADRDSMECKYKRKAPDGTAEWCLTSISVCERSDDGMPMTVSMLIRSIDDLVAAEEQRQVILTEALEDARRANHAKSDFLSSMSHDMRTPLNVITGMATLARIHGDDPEMVKDSLEKIEVSSKHLLSLVNGVLDMAKIETGEIELDDSAFSLSNMMEDIVLMTQSMIAGKHQVLNFNLKNPKYEDVIGDENRLTQAILNVLTNAIKYTDRHGRIEVEIRETAFDGITAAYRFTIRDNGCGMSEEFQKHVFEPFTREVDMRLNKVMGTGLGLAITKKIIDKMGGTIRLTSQVGKGSEFVIEVPLKVQQKGMKEMTFPEERILIVDDHIPCIDSICSVVESLLAGHQAASTGEKALALLEENQHTTHPFTAVIVDYIMPDMDGITLTRKIRERYGNDLPVIMISAYDYSMVKKDAARAGINFFCTKPIFRSKLLRIFPYLHSQEKDANENQIFTNRKHRKIRALLAEDNVLNAAIARNLLEYLGLEVAIAEDGKDAVDTFRMSGIREFDCIFMDVQMPVMNGLAAAKVIRAMGREDSDIPIFAMTANVFTEDVRQTREAGMQEHIGKPIELGQIRHILERYFPDVETAEVEIPEATDNVENSTTAF